MLDKLNIKRSLPWVLLISCAWTHPFHVSISTFQLNQKTRNLEITMKLFTEDLESVIETNELPPIKLGSKNEYIKSDSLIFDYLRANINLSLDNKQVYSQWVGKEIENDITWCYLEINNVGEYSTATIVNTIFIANFTDQLNISHFQDEDQIETVMNHKSKISGNIQFKKKDN